MALKRVSDLERRTFSDIKEKIDDIYGNDITKSKILPTSKIEVSETQNFDTSLFKSYAYDLNALSGIFTDQIIHKDIKFEGDKIFDDDVIINGSLSVVSNQNGSRNDVIIKKQQVTIDSTTTISLESEKGSTNISSGDEINIASNSNTNIISESGDIKIETPNNLLLNSYNTTLSSDNNINFTYKDKLEIKFQPSEGEPITVVTFGHRGNIPTVTFNQEVIKQSNPIDGVINHALWS